MFDICNVGQQTVGFLIRIIANRQPIADPATSSRLRLAGTAPSSPIDDLGPALVNEYIPKPSVETLGNKIIHASGIALFLRCTDLT